MPALLIRHTVADYAAWKPHFDAHDLTRRANGSRGGWVSRSADDPTAVVIFLEWDDLERARFFADSDDLREAMTRAGVSSSQDVWFLEEADRPVV